MSIAITCSRCNTLYTVPGHLAGKTIACKTCNALLDVPLDAGPRASLRPVSGETSYQRIVGRPPPLILDILGLHTRWADDFGSRDILLLVWSCRHVALLIILLAFWSRYSGSPLSAEAGAPWFFAGGILIVLSGWLQISLISRSLTAAIGGGHSGSLLPHILSSFLLVVTNPRAAFPALRTLFLGVLALWAAFALAAGSGNWAHVLPLNSLPTFTTPSRPRAIPIPEETPRPTATAPAPLPPPPEEKPLPPPDESTPIPPPPG